MGTNIHVSMKYLSRLPLYQEEKPFELWIPSNPGVPQTNCKFQAENDIAIADARFCEEKLDLETSGFQFIRHSSSCIPTAKDLAGRSQETVTPYLRETVSLVQSHLDAEKSFCFDWRVGSTALSEYLLLT